MSSAPDAVEALAAHAIGVRSDALPDAAREAARRLLADTLAVGVAGSAWPHALALVRAHQGLGAVGQARLLGRPLALPAAAAALVNATQIHSSEFDCVHEAAVVHPMAVVLGAILGWAEREGHGHGRRVSIDEALAAVAVGVDVAVTLGLCARGGLRFFRPATAGAFGAGAALARLAGLDHEATVRCLGLVLGQVCGTMQAHTEGSAMLPLQVGFDARNALVAVDLAAAGVPAPREVVQGPYGYLPLFEGEHDAAGPIAELGRRWRVCEVSHKPFPSGRATHGVVDACLRLRAAHRVEAGDVESVRARVPPLTFRLVGRRPRPGMAPNEARLCAAYVAARALASGTVALEDFAPCALADDATLELADRVVIEPDDNPDPNALTPITVELRTRGGARHEVTLDTVYGHPARPLTDSDLRAKIAACLAASAWPLAADAARRLVTAVLGDGAGAADAPDDLRGLVDLSSPAPGASAPPSGGAAT